MAELKMPHPGHDAHLCFLENIGHLQPNLMEMGISTKEEYKDLVRGAKFFCKKCGRAAKNERNLCEPEKL
jgi:hypothetical protein